MNDGYCNGGNLPGTFIIENQRLYQDYEWYKALEDSELKDEALRNKAIMEGFIKDDDDESNYEEMRRWDIYTNYDDTCKTNHDDNEREELCKAHEPLVCTIQRFEMIKYSFGQGEEYVAIKEDEYDNLTRKSNNACRLSSQTSIWHIRSTPRRIDCLDVISLYLLMHFKNIIVNSTNTYQDRNAPVFPIFYAGPREGNIDEYWWRIYESGNLEVLES
ncbi:hypothetical protein Tco_0401734 [Tanacetum coccineum]